MTNTPKNIVKFQFLIVRLKLPADFFSMQGLKFQFLIVRLKSNKYTHEKLFVGWFQFLIVRLKCSRFSCSGPCTEVSIPYSTIKILMWMYLLILLQVSIPYSTIKMQHSTLYQPQMPVSIPYSTIKIKPNPGYANGTVQFQFLIVRLK